jgi:hypothetical protein
MSGPASTACQPVMLSSSHLSSLISHLSPLSSLLSPLSSLLSPLLSPLSCSRHPRQLQLRAFSPLRRHLYALARSCSCCSCCIARSCSYVLCLGCLAADASLRYPVVAAAAATGVPRLRYLCVRPPLCDFSWTPGASLPIRPILYTV